MSDPSRLLDGDGTEVERRLLQAGVHDEPSPEGMRRAAAALGLALSTGAVAGSAAATAPTAASWATTSWASLITLGLGVGLVGAGVAGVIAWSATLRPTAAPLPAPSSPISRSPTLARAEASAPNPPAPAASVPHSAPRPAGRPANALAPSASGSISSLPAEIALIDAARQTLGSGDGAGALALLDRHGREHPNGALGQEATLLRIEALATSGNRAAARALAERFLARQPRSPHRKRIESLVGPL